MKKQKADIRQHAKQLKENVESQVGRDEKSLSTETEAARKKAAEDSEEAKKKHDKDIAAHAKQLKENCESQVGRDDKGTKEPTLPTKPREGPPRPGNAPVEPAKPGKAP